MARVIIVSNRLPVSVKKEDGKLVFSQSTGGVATGLASYANNPNNRWIGWPGIASDDITPAERREISRELARHNCIPVFLTKRQIDDFYNGYSNSILWPLFHNLPVHGKKNREQWWRGYRSVNKLFSDAVQKVAHKHSRIWVHDYQLLLVPEQIRASHPHANIGFFLHIPFPRPKVFTKLPEAKKLFVGMLGARLVGFHTSGYVNNFLDTCDELGIGTVGNSQVLLGDRVIRVTDFPMGIDYQKYAESGKSAAVRAAVLKYKLRYRGQKVIVAVDRLDPSKGLVERLEAYREFLQQNQRKLRGKVVFSMVAAPSRTDIDVYKKLQIKLDELVADINAEFGTKRWQPIDYMNVSLPFEEVSALLQVADVAFIAPIRDGMNLVAKEYVASRRQHGVLILSETAGAAQELSDALLVNPARRASVVEALEKSITMPRRELKKRFNAMQDQLSANTVHHWAGNFMKTLQQPVVGSQRNLRTPSLTTARAAKIINNYRTSSKHLLLLDYDGTLQPHTEHYTHAAPPAKLLRLLETLSGNDKNEVVLISGRSQNDLQEWFGNSNLNLIAEHGASVKSAGHKTWHETVTSGRRWKKTVLPVLQHYTDLTPKAHIEEKQYSLVWHYRQSPAFAAQKNIQILQRVLRPITSQFGLEIISGNKILEIKDPGINKGNAVRRWLRKEHDFVLVIGDDFTDEDMFAAVPASATTIKVGRGRTIASFRAANSEEVIALLAQLKN